MAVITVSRQMGSLGDEIAQHVAMELGYKYLNRELIAEAAEDLGVDPETAAKLDQEAKPTLLARIAERFLPRTGPEPLGCRYEPGSKEPCCSVLDEESYQDLVAGIIRQHAAEGDVVIVGRGGQALLAGKPDTLHVSVIAPDERRVARCIAAGVAPDERHCREMLEDSDEHRRNYIRSFFDADWTDPHLYDMTINTARIGLMPATLAIVECVRQLGNEKREEKQV